MSHNHSVPKNKNLGKLILSILVNIVIVIFEIIYGVLIGSLALISDAIHNLTDIASMVLSYIGEKISARPVSDRRTYGYKKVEAIVAFVNSSILLAVIIFILIEATKRLFNPIEINGISMLIVAGIAFLGNGMATLILQSKEKNLNMKSAWLHSLQDTLFSLAIIVASILIYYFHWQILDPLISIFVSLFLIKEAYEIIKDSIDMLLDSVPEDINFKKVKKAILQVSGIEEVNDLHIWQSSSSDKLLSVHIIINNRENEMIILSDIKKVLHNNFKITHTTIQIMTSNEAKQMGEKCEHCN